jgi:hypothetical protein
VNSDLFSIFVSATDGSVFSENFSYGIRSSEMISLIENAFEGFSVTGSCFPEVISGLYAFFSVI